MLAGLILHLFAFVSSSGARLCSDMVGNKMFAASFRIAHCLRLLAI
ncbi:hypothetical protein B4109_1360 [Geobacillus stearothermophilus]|uniref:Uncharacterized protein n=1 Tax=Geobacillus stearothermophilus TaxID=1422 RepID=A0A150ML49_GEOSE|nr:hypothetical protein B4109_1360 [Geobacillus stearothermophilus]